MRELQRYWWSDAYLTELATQEVGGKLRLLGEDVRNQGRVEVMLGLKGAQCVETTALFDSGARVSVMTAAAAEKRRLAWCASCPRVNSCVRR